MFEAKLGSSLSGGTKHCQEYDQAARNVACLLWAAVKAGLDLERVKLGFWVVAPEVQRTAFAGTNKPDFDQALDPSHIAAAVETRLDVWLKGLRKEDRESCKNAMGEWLAKAQACLDPATLAVDIGFISWEEVADSIGTADAAMGAEFADFYALCKKENGIPDSP